MCLNLNASCANTRAVDDMLPHGITALTHLPAASSPPSCNPLLPSVPDSHIESIQSLRLKAAEQMIQLRENGTTSS